MSASQSIGDRIPRHAVTALSALAEIVAVVVWTRWAGTHHLVRTHGLSWIAPVVFAAVLATILHECGHALLAWCFQMHLFSFHAGPFQWARREGKRTFKFHPAGLITVGGSAGAAAANPIQPRWEELLVLAAGSAANLLFGLPAVWAVLHDRWGSYQHTWEFAAFTGSFSIIAAVVNLVPFTAEDGAVSDGAHILQMLTRNSHEDLCHSSDIAYPTLASVLAEAPTLVAAASNTHALSNKSAVGHTVPTVAPLPDILARVAPRTSEPAAPPASAENTTRDADSLSSIGRSAPANFIDPAEDRLAQLLARPASSAAPTAIPTIPRTSTEFPIIKPPSGPGWTPPGISAINRPPASTWTRPRSPSEGVHTSFTPALAASPSQGPAVPPAFARRARVIGPPLPSPFAGLVSPTIATDVPLIDFTQIDPPQDIPIPSMQQEASF